MEKLNIPFKVYSLSEAAKVAGVDKRFLQKGIDDGNLKYVKNGSVTYITENALENFFQCGLEYLTD